MPAIDPIDKSILHILQKDAKASPKEIASKLNLTRTPIVERIKKLERSGIISKYVAILNPLKIEKLLTVFCFVSLKEHSNLRVKEFEVFVNRSNKVMECFHIAGNHDFILKVMVKNVEDYQNFVLNELSTIKNISNVHSSFVMGKLKHTLSFDLSELKI